MCSNLTIKRPERRQRCLNFNFIVSFTYFGDFIVDFQHISHLSYVLYTGKKVKSKFDRWQIEVFLLPSISNPSPPTPQCY